MYYTHGYGTNVHINAIVRMVHSLSNHLVVWSNLLAEGIPPFLTGVIQGAGGVVTPILVDQLHIHSAILKLMTTHLQNKLCYSQLLTGRTLQDMCVPIHHSREVVGALVKTSLTGSNCILKGLLGKYEFHFLSAFILLSPEKCT